MRLDELDVGVSFKLMVLNIEVEVQPAPVCLLTPTQSVDRICRRLLRSKISTTV
jgi:hypothetical protein